MPRSASVWARFSDATRAVSPIPCPVARYQGLPAGLMRRLLPELELARVGSGAVVAGGEESAAFRDPLQRVDGGEALDLGGIGRRPDEDEVVVHDVEPQRPETLGHELVLGRFRVDEEDVGVAPAPHCERLAGADSDRLHRQARGRFESREKVVEEAAVLGARRRGEDERGLRGARERRGQEEQGEGPGGGNGLRTHGVRSRLASGEAGASYFRGRVRYGVAGTSSRVSDRSICFTTALARRRTPSRIRSIGMFE